MTLNLDEKRENSQPRSLSVLSSFPTIMTVEVKERDPFF